jgi:hypothetical protein
MPNLTDRDVHEIALVISRARAEIGKVPGLEAVERDLFKNAECRLGASLPPVTVNLGIPT